MYRSNVGRDTVGLPNMDPVRVGIGGNQSVGAKTCFSDRLIDIFDAFCQKIIQFFVKKSDHYPRSVAQICSWREQYSIVILAGYTCWTIGSWSSAFVGQSTPIKKKKRKPLLCLQSSRDVLCWSKFGGATFSLYQKITCWSFEWMFKYPWYTVIYLHLADVYGQCKECRQICTYYYKCYYCIPYMDPMGNKMHWPPSLLMVSIPSPE